MKGLNQTELEQICDEIQTWVGAQLQEVVMAETHIALGFYHRQKVEWLMFDFATQSPVCLLLDADQVRRLTKQTKPLSLFLRAHFEGKRISDIELVRDQGRVMRIGFHAPDTVPQLSLEIILFSYAKNFIAQAGDKKMSFFKPKEISKQELAPQQDFNLSARSFHVIRDEWLAEKGLIRGENREAQPQDKLEKARKTIEKKELALEKMRLDLEKKIQSNWGEAGEWLKLNQNLNAPKEFSAAIDPEKSLSQNISNCFAKAKDQDRKIRIAQDRLNALVLEIEKLKQGLLQENFIEDRAKFNSAGKPNKSFLQKVGAQARTLRLDENLQAYIGKSAKDNLDILRRAQPFDLWLHLRDLPSAHVVIRKTRERQVTDAELRKIAHWLIAENFGKNAKSKSGESFDLIVCECRFVKPIKGDKLGRVNFQNDRSLRVKFEL